MYILTELKGNLVESFSLSTWQKINQNKTLKKVHYEHFKSPLSSPCWDFLYNRCLHLCLQVGPEM